MTRLNKDPVGNMTSKTWGKQSCEPCLFFQLGDFERALHVDSDLFTVELLSFYKKASFAVNVT